MAAPEAPLAPPGAGGVPFTGRSGATTAPGSGRPMTASGGSGSGSGGTPLPPPPASGATASPSAATTHSAVAGETRLLLDVRGHAGYTPLPDDVYAAAFTHRLAWAPIRQVAVLPSGETRRGADAAAAAAEGKEDGKGGWRREEGVPQ